jgi:acyl-CoA thioester hydrolase
MSQHTQQIRIYYEDTDAGGIVYYANYLKFAERARTEWLRSLGFSQQHLRTALGISFVVKSCHADYHAPAFLDDAIIVNTRIDEQRKAGFSVAQQVMREDVLLCTITVVIICVNADMKPIRIPDAITQAIRAWQSTV